ncbi:hypothetical protein KBD61_03645 [Patescibacteria group bacterium]|nr:hypothetical protein [Patescibacteria group bacterium]MBP9710091.1 hypothetical protein [Patescibacteria group bacterium]
MSAESLAGFHKPVSEKRAEQVLADRKAKSWMESVLEFQRSSKGALAWKLFLGLQTMGGIGVTVDRVSAIRETIEARAHSGEATVSEPVSDFKIDNAFQEVGFSPVVLQTGVREAFGSLAGINVHRIEYRSQHIPMPASYRGTSPYEAGHCTLSEDKGVRSHIVLTVDAAEGQSVRSFSHTLFHEAAHAIDPENADQIPERIKVRLQGALQEVVHDNSTTIYSYINAYEGGSSSEQEEDRLQRKELFAELMADALTMEPLAANDPLLRQPVNVQFTHRLARKYNKPLDEMMPYGWILGLVGDWRGSDFFQHGQEAHQRLVTRLEADRGRVQQEHFSERVSSELGRLALPSLDQAIQRWVQAPEDQARSNAKQRVDDVLDGQDRFRSPSLSQAQAALARRWQGVVRTLEQDRDRYDLSFLTSRGVHDPQLRYLFSRLTRTTYGSHSSLETLSSHTRLASRVISSESKRSEIDSIHSDVEFLNNILRQASQVVGPNDPQFIAFRSAVFAWIEGEMSGAWLSGIESRVPDMADVYEDMLDMGSRDQEGNRER